MSTEVRWRRGTAAQHASFTGALAEVTVNTDKKALHVHDGSTAGGNRTLMASELGAANGVASLDAAGKIITSQISGAVVLSATPQMSAPPTITTAQLDQNGIANAAYISGIDLTGASDASAKLQIALDAIANRFAILGEGHGGELLLPEGSVLKVGATLNFTANCPIAVRTSGNRKGSRILQNVATLFHFESDVATPEINSWQTVTIDGLHIINRAAAATAFNIVSPEMVKVSNIYGYPDPAVSGAYWAQFFNGTNIRTSFLTDWYVRNTNDTSVKANLRGAAINLNASAGSTDNKYKGLLMQGFNVAWNAVTSTSPAVEGQHFEQCSVVMCNKGLIWSNTHATYVPPLLYWLNGHMHCCEAWMEASKTAQIDISHSTLELDGVFNDTQAGFTGTNISGVTISDNKMYFVNMTAARSAVVLAGSSVMGKIHDNAGVLTASPAAIQLLTGTSNCNAHDNEFYGTTQVISNSGTNNIVGVNNRILT